MIRSQGKDTICLYGGSPIASLWAVYELASAWGVVFSLQGDMMPVKTPDNMIPDIDKIYTPRQELRSWRLMNELIFGPVSWTLKQQKKVILQLVKQKYNGVMFSFWTQQPFVNYELDGIKRDRCALNFGMKIPVTKENIGLGSLYLTENYCNPEFDNCITFEDHYSTAFSYMTEVMGFAKKFEMTISIAFQPFDFTPEFAPLMQAPSKVLQLGFSTISESGDIFNPKHIDLLKMQFDAYTSTYPMADMFQIGLPEHARNMTSYEDAIVSLDRKFGISSKYDIDKILNDRVAANITAGGYERSINEGRMSLVMIDVLHKLLDMTGSLRSLGRAGKKLGITAGISCPQILPVISNVLWDDASLTVSVGYTSSRSERSARFFEDINTGKVTVYQNITLQDDNEGFLPQVAATSIKSLVEAGVKSGIKGYFTRFWPIGDLDPVSYFLSEASWKTSITPEKAYGIYLGNLYGDNATAPISNVLRLLEDATILNDIDLGILFPVLGLISDSMSAENAGSLSGNKWAAFSIYTEAAHILSKVNVSSNKNESEKHLLYLKSRIEFGRLVFLGLSYLMDGNNSQKSNNIKDAVSNYEKMVKCFKDALEAFSLNIRDDSDRASLAVYYHILVRESEEKIRKINDLI